MSPATWAKYLDVSGNLTGVQLANGMVVVRRSGAAIPALMSNDDIVSRELTANDVKRLIATHKVVRVMGNPKTAYALHFVSKRTGDDVKVDKRTSGSLHLPAPDRVLKLSSGGVARRSALKDAGLNGFRYA